MEAKNEGGGRKLQLRIESRKVVLRRNGNAAREHPRNPLFENKTLDGHVCRKLYRSVIIHFTYIKSKTSIAINEIENFRRNNIVESINSAANLFHIGGMRYS